MERTRKRRRRRKNMYNIYTEVTSIRYTYIYWLAFKLNFVKYFLKNTYLLYLKH